MTSIARTCTEPPGAPSPRLELVHGGAAVRLHGVDAQRGERLALQGIDIALPAGRLIAVVGPNGAGKSTLLDLVAGRLAPLRGRVEIAPALRGRLAHLPQRPTLDTGFPVSVLETAMLGHWRRLGAFGWVRRRHVDQARAALEQVGLAAMGERLIGELSAGQLQRLLFARLALLDAPLVLLDEPFAAVDAATTAALMRLLRQWRDEGRTVVAATHDLQQVRAHFDHAVLLARRVVASGAPAASLADEPLAEAGRLAWTLT